MGTSGLVLVTRVTILLVMQYCWGSTMHDNRFHMARLLLFLSLVFIV